MFDDFLPFDNNISDSDFIQTPHFITDVNEPACTFNPEYLNNDTFVIGTPDVLRCEQQIAADNCAVEAERSIINMFVSDPLSQQEAMYISASHGWYQPGVGTSPEVIGQMMELHGIPNHSVIGASTVDLVRELAQGHGVIVGVDSTELWDRGPLAELKQYISANTGVDFGDSGANHAIVVTGIDVSDPVNPMVIINDSGVPGGQGTPYSMEKFLQAWEDSGFYYTATDVPLPASSLHGTNADMGQALSNMSLGCSMNEVNVSFSAFVGGAVAAWNGLENYAETGNAAAALADAFHSGTRAAETTHNILQDLFRDNNAIVDL